MKHNQSTNLLFLLVITSLVLISSCKQQPTYNYPFQNPELSTPERVQDLVQRLTPEEKAAQLLYNAPAIERLGIPAYNWWNECLHGVARNGLATVFPQAIGMAATFDTAQISQIAVAISDEARAKYHRAIQDNKHGIYQGLTFWTPNINIFRDPRWGRGMETYGEDPYLTGSLAVKFIQGLQGSNPNYFKTIATAKHFAVHNGPESSRHVFNAEVSKLDLYNTYLPHFKRTVEEANVQSIMCAYNRLDGEPCCGNNQLLDNILRTQWGFNGYVVTDCWGLIDFFNTHGFSDGPVDASAAALLAGTDLNCGVVYNNLTEALDSGLISMAEIDTALTRLFTARFQLGMFDRDEDVPYAAIPYEVVNSPEHQKIAMETTRKSMVLLKNNNATLPLKKDLKKIALIGPHAKNETSMLGNYHGIPDKVITPYEGIKAKLDSDTKLVYARGCNVAKELPYLESVAANYIFTDSTLHQQGLKAEFFTNDSLFGTPKHSIIHDSLDVNWWDDAPFADMPDDQFSIRWTGYLVPPESGEYHFGGDGSHDFRVYLNDNMLAEHTDLHYKKSATGKIYLEAGQPYKLQVDFINHERFAMMKLVWALPVKDLMAEAVHAARDADAIILCMGLSPRLEGEEMDVKIDGFSGGDRTSLNLPKEQLQLMKEIKKLGKPTILLLFNGSALALNWENDNIDAILEAWYPGQASGTALADILFGDYNPAGRLPVTFYKSVTDLPDFENYDMANRTYRYFAGEPLYEFGYGLSFTQFEYKNLKSTAGAIRNNQNIQLEFEIENTGEYDGEEVVQFYLSKKESRFIRPIKELKAFQRIFIPTGSTKNIEFTLKPSDLVFYDEQGNEIIEPGAYEIMVGSSSKQIHLKTTVSVD